jgi:hypothetical protein
MRRKRSYSIALLAPLCFACATTPDKTPGQLTAENLAVLRVVSPALWGFKAGGRGQSYFLEITAVDGHNVCSPNYCPTQVYIPAGPGSVEVLCGLVLGNLRIPKQAGHYRGSFVAGHTYGIRPLTLVPRCDPEIVNITGDQR